MFNVILHIHHIKCLSNISIVTPYLIFYLIIPIVTLLMFFDHPTTQSTVIQALAIVQFVLITDFKIEDSYNKEVIYLVKKKIGKNYQITRNTLCLQT